MKHRCTRDVVEDLRRGGRLIEIEDPVDPYLEMAEIQTARLRTQTGLRSCSPIFAGADSPLFPIFSLRLIKPATCFETRLSLFDA